MAIASTEYVWQTPAGGWRIQGTRVSLDSVVHAYLDGESAETIADSFPSLSLEQIHGTIAFYLKHREEIGAYLDSQALRWESFREESERANGPLLDRLRSHARRARRDHGPR